MKKSHFQIAVLILSLALVLEIAFVFGAPQEAPPKVCSTGAEECFGKNAGDSCGTNSKCEATGPNKNLTGYECECQLGPCGGCYFGVCPVGQECVKDSGDVIMCGKAITNPYACKPIPKFNSTGFSKDLI